MKLRHCDYCGNQFKELSRVEVGKRNKEWFVCADCLTHKVPRISKETEVPLLSTLFQFGASKAMSTLQQPNYRMTFVCPRCDKESEHVGPIIPKPRLRCGDCLMDRVEVVELTMLTAEQVEQ